jgi:hypothetical protein
MVLGEKHRLTVYICVQVKGPTNKIGTLHKLPRKISSLKATLDAGNSMNTKAL